MKRGDQVFIHTVRGVTTVGTVAYVADHEIRIDVENGGFELRITKPDHAFKGDYNDQIEKFRKERRW